LGGNAVKLVLCSIGAAFVSVALGSPAHAATSTDGQITVVQAVPGAVVDVTIDGKPVQRQVKVGSLIGPLSLSSGTHELLFSGGPGGRPIKTSLGLKAGSSTDVVLHRPASVDGAPVVSTYRTPQSPIGPEKARILLAHTATVAPADVKFDGKVVFTNIANGEFADADVPAGAHEVALLPTGVTKDPLLGPLTLTLPPRTATMVYAVGSPENGSMDAIVHRVGVRADGSIAPRSIDTGSAGLARHVQVVPFSRSATPPHRSGEHAVSRADHTLPGFVYGLAGLLLAGLGVRWRRDATAVPTERPATSASTR